MPQARCDVACTTLQALLLNAAQVNTLLLLPFQQQYLAHLNSKAHLYPRLPQDLTSYYIYHNSPPGPTSWPQHPWAPTYTEDLRYATPYWNHVAAYTEYENTDLQPTYQQYQNTRLCRVNMPALGRNLLWTTRQQSEQQNNR